MYWDTLIWISDCRNLCVNTVFWHKYIVLQLIRNIYTFSLKKPFRVWIGCDLHIVMFAIVYYKMAFTFQVLNGIAHNRCVCTFFFLTEKYDIFHNIFAAGGVDFFYSSTSRVRVQTSCRSTIIIQHIQCIPQNIHIPFRVVTTYMVEKLKKPLKRCMAWCHSFSFLLPGILIPCQRRKISKYYRRAMSVFFYHRTFFHALWGEISKMLSR